MSSYKEIYNNLCRICLSYCSDEDTVSLVGNFSEDGLSVYGRAVISFANISIKTNNNLPSSMCKQCLSLLKQAVCFKLRCESSEKQLKEWTEIYQQTKGIGFKIEEIVVDNIMFSKYFPEETSEERYVHQNDKSNIKVSSTDEESEICESEHFSQDNNNDNNMQDCDNDSSDELLNLMEENIGKYPNLESIDYKTYIQKKLILKTRRRAKLQAKQYKHQSAQNALKLKSLKMKVLARSALTKEKLFCTTCNRKFSTLSSYKYHMQRHNGYNFICEHCGKCFRSFAELNLHQVARHGTGPYIECKHCNFKASRKHDLIEHERLHTGERPYTCDKCGLTFRRRAIWRKHMIYHTEKTVQCTQCSKKFFRHSEMLAHMNNMHERIYLYACHKCNVTYAKTASVRRHLTEKHGIPREEQGKIVRINKRR